MGEQMVGLGVEGAVARLTLRRPKVLNALSAELLEELIAACVRLVDRDDIRVVLLSGEGRAFSAGADLTMFGEVPPAVVRDLVLTCREFDADEALAFGLVSRVVEPGELDDEVAALAAGLADKARLPVRATLDAVAANLGVGAPHGWSDADTLLSAIRDPESRAAGQAYAARVFRSELGSADASDVPSSPSVDRG